MTEDQVRQAIVDQEHLKLLAIGYLISGGLDGFFSLFGLVYVFFGIFMSAVMAHQPVTTTQAPPPEFLGWFFAFFGLGIFLLMITSLVLKVLVYRRLTQRRSRVFCMVIAALGCIWLPYGTLLSIFTFLVLGRSSVIQLFQESGRPDPIANGAVGGG